MAGDKNKIGGRAGERYGPRVGAVAAVVLAGGAGRRMFPKSDTGGDKAQALLGGRALLAHVVERLQPQVLDLAIATRGDGRKPANGDPILAGISIVHDAASEHDGRGMGPLAGLLAGMEWARKEAPYCPLLLSVPADVPFLPRDLAARLAAHLQAIESDVLMVRSRGQVHPAVALWSTELLADLRRAVLQEGVRKVEDFAQRHKRAELDWPRGGADPFLNLNSPADLAKAERRLASRQDQGKSSSRT